MLLGLDLRHICVREVGDDDGIPVPTLDTRASTGGVNILLSFMKRMECESHLDFILLRSCICRCRVLAMQKRVLGMFPFCSLGQVLWLLVARRLKYAPIEQRGNKDLMIQAMRQAWLATAHASPHGSSEALGASRMVRHKVPRAGRLCYVEPKSCDLSSLCQPPF